jgi:thiol-disulfide isomerase/thioredoxin
VKRRNTLLKFLVILPMTLLFSFSPALGTADGFVKIPADATAKNLEGKVVSLADYKGKLLFLSIWKTDCFPCLLEIPILNRLQKEYASDDFTVIGISVDRGKNKFVVDLVEKAKINYPVWLAYGEPILKYIEPPMTPFLLVVGPEGEVLGYVPGKIPTYDDAVGVMNQARALIAEHNKQK